MKLRKHIEPLFGLVTLFASLSLPAYAASSSPPAAQVGAFQANVEVVHFWVSLSERNSLDVYRRAWKRLGGKWTDVPTKDKNAELKLVTERIANGYAPTVIQWHANEGSKELPAMGVVNDIEDVAKADRWRDFLPKDVIDQVSYKGRIYFAPMDIHAENWLWVSKRIFDKLKLPLPKSWESLIDSAEKIKAAGYTPIAIGSGSWEISLIFNDIIYSVFGYDDYVRLMSGADPQAAMSPKMLKALTLLRRLGAYAQPSRAGKTWAEASLSVAQGRAAMQFMGDWAKGEMMEAGYSVGKDFTCLLAPGTESVYFIVVDAFAFPVTNDENDRRSQLLFARQIMNTENQLAFNRIKGSIPARIDVQRGPLDACGKIGLDLMSRKGQHVSAQSMTMPSQMSEGWIGVVADFFNDPKMKPEMAQRQLANVLSQK